MASFIYNAALQAMAIGGIDYDTDSFKIMLVTSAYTPTDAHENRSDVTNESSGTNYTAGGKVITCTVNRDDANDRVDVVFDPVSWPVVTLTTRAAVIYKDTGTATTDRLVAYVDFGSNKTPAATTLDVSITSPLRIQKA